MKVQTFSFNFSDSIVYKAREGFFFVWSRTNEFIVVVDRLSADSYEHISVSFANLEQDHF